MNDDYRARATRAEQENARLREQLAKKPKYAGLQKTVTEMLKLPPDAPVNEIARVLKYLRDNKELYEAGREHREITQEQERVIFDRGRKHGKSEILKMLEELHRRGEL